LVLKRIEKEIALGVDEAVRHQALARKSYLSRLEECILHNRKLEEQIKLFNVGRSSSFVVISYQQELHQAEFQSIKSLYDYRVALIDLALIQNSLLNKLGIGPDTF